MPTPNLSQPAAARLSERQTKEHISFEQWLSHLDTAALTLGFRQRIAKATGEEAWLTYYEDGYTPREALAEDLHHTQ